MFEKNQKLKLQHEPTKSPHFPPRGKIGQLSKKKCSYCWSIIVFKCLFILFSNCLLSFIVNKYLFIKLLLCRVPAGEIFKLSLSPYFDDIAVFHVRAVSFNFFIIKSLTFFSIILKGWSHGRLKACS